MDSINKIVVENILARMENLQWNQRVLAQKANMDPVQLNRILKFKKKAGAVSLRKIATALGCEPEELQHKSQPPTPSAAKMIELIAELQKEIDALKARPVTGEILNEEELKFLRAYQGSTPARRIECLSVLTDDPDDIRAYQAFRDQALTDAEAIQRGQESDEPQAAVPKVRR